jgi:hypothetical protein
MAIIVSSLAISGPTTISRKLSSLVSLYGAAPIQERIPFTTQTANVWFFPLVYEETVVWGPSHPYVLSPIEGEPPPTTQPKREGIFNAVLEPGNPGTAVQSSGVQVVLRVPSETTKERYPFLPPSVVL